jgi:hypothetical protein
VVPTVVLELVIVIVCGAAPQLKLMLPPPFKAVVKAASVQLAGVPLPTVPAAAAEEGMSNVVAASDNASIDDASCRTILVCSSTIALNI